MALPQSINAADPADADNPSGGAARIRQLKLFIQDVLGFSDNVAYTAAALAITTAGVITVKQNPLAPDSSDGSALGSATKMWADLFLASGGVINFNNGNVTLTHAAGQLTLGGGNLSLADELILADAAASATAAGRLRRNGKLLTWHSGDGAQTLQGVIDRDVTTTDVVSTADETTVYSFSVPGGTLGTNRALRLKLIGDWLNTPGTNSLTVRTKFGGTTLFSTAITVGANASRHALFYELMLSAHNATNAQVATLHYFEGGATTAGAPPTILGNAGQSNTGVGVYNALAIDSTVAQTLEVTFQNGAADAGLSSRCLAVHLELL
jgi:hypothetical protein